MTGPGRSRSDSASASALAERTPLLLLPPRHHEQGTVINALCIVIFIICCSGGFTQLPLTRLMEDILCHRYYGIEDFIDESMCKVDGVQKELAYILAIKSTLFAVVGCVAAFPWGVAADRVGRKPIIVLAVAGLLVSVLMEMTVVYWHDVFPLTAVWAAAAGQAIGGGDAVLIAVISTMVTDATREEDRAMSFLRVHVSNLCGSLLSPSLSAIVMSRFGKNLWISPFIGLSLLVGGGIGFIFLPETIPPPPSSSSTSKKSKSSMRTYLTILKSSPIFLLTLLCSMPVFYSTLNFLNQFVSVRYHITIAQTGYVQSAYGIASIFASLIVLPFISKHLAPNSRDLFLARTSYLALLLGSLTMSLAPSLVLFVLGLVLLALGSGAGSLTKSLMSSRVDADARTRLFSLASVVEVLGSVFAQPMLAALFSLGLGLGNDDDDGGYEFWIGLPYFGIAVLVALAGGLLVFVKEG
ncbi:major facilitator superfamily transporter [Poronia punctata]|nr:major facilitator superfamily transporter [Poronia punctata]